MAVMRIVTVSDEDSAVLHTAASRVRVFRRGVALDPG